MRSLKVAQLLLIVQVWSICAAVIQAAEKRQVQAIWSFQGPCYPVPNANMIEVITNVVNPLTAVPWGTQTQSGGFSSLCSKAGIQGCNSNANLISTPVIPTPTPPSTPSQDAALAPSTSDTAPAADGGPALAPAPAATSAVPVDTAAAPSPSSATSRRLLQGSADCSNKVWYLYLDTTEPDTLPNGAWDSQTIINRVKAVMASGEFKQALSKTAISASSVTLRYIGINYVQETANPAPSADGGSGGAGSGSGGDAGGSSGTPPSGDSNYQTNWGSTTPVPGQGQSGSVSSSSGGDGTTEGTGGSTGSKAAVIAGVIGGVMGAAILAALVGALVLRRRNLKKARAKVNADMEAHRKGRHTASRFKLGGSAGSRSYSRHTFDKPSPSSVGKPSPASFSLPPSAPVASTQSSMGGRASPRKAGPTWAERAAGTHEVTAHTELESQDEFHTVLDATFERSATSEIPSPERKPRFLGIFGSKS